MTRKNWITALACCALLALGACSSSGDKKVGLDRLSPEGLLAVARTTLADAKAEVKKAGDAFNEAMEVASAAMSQADGDSAAFKLTPLQIKARNAVKAADKALEDAQTAANAAVSAAKTAKAKEDANKVLDDAKAYKTTATDKLNLAMLTVAVWDAHEAAADAGDAVTTKQEKDLRAAKLALDEALEDEDASPLKTALLEVSKDAGELTKSWAWATGEGLKPGAVRSAASPQKITVVRTPRTGDAQAGWEKLDIEKDGVRYIENVKGRDNFVISPEGKGTTAELPMRAFTVRQFHYVQGKNVAQRDGSMNTAGNTSGELDTSIQLTEDGLVMKTGGDAVFYDMQREFPVKEDAKKSANYWAGIGADGQKGFKDSEMVGTATDAHVAALKAAGVAESDLPTAGTSSLSSEHKETLKGLMDDNCWTAGGKTCGNWAHDDLTITFKTPSQVYDGSAVWYWSERIPLSDDQDPNKIQALENRSNKDLGRYDLWLSNHAGVDDDDEHSYLSHAVYGMFQQLDNINPYNTSQPDYSRSQAFYAGYETFANENGKRPNDLAKQITGTFTGRTMAHALARGTDKKHRPQYFDLLRGNISLLARIGGEGRDQANTITGKIDKLELFKNGTWNDDYDEVSEVTLSGRIFSDDTVGVYYSGTAEEKVQNTPDKIYTADGSFQGRFYGPNTNPETAGWWELSNSENPGGNGRAKRRIIGSYGAVCTSGCAD